jgi:hypothetical protein
VPAPRLFGIAATEADVVAVLRRGPSGWTHVARWDVSPGCPDRQRFEPGAWVRSHLYQQSCDLSPDGRWLCYFTLDGNADWPPGTTYVAVSRLPWVTALAAWGTQGTYTGGAHFVTDGPGDWPAPDVGTVEPLLRRYGLATTVSLSFAVERRRGWIELPDALVPIPERSRRTRPKRRPVAGRPRPGGGSPVWLTACGAFAALRQGPRRPDGADYALRDAPDDPAGRPLPGVEWADWSRDGRLLVATDDGHLQIRDGDGRAVRWDLDLTPLHPDPQPPPPEAGHW